MMQLALLVCNYFIPQVDQDSANSLGKECVEQAQAFIIILNLQKFLHIGLFVGNAFEEFFSKKVFAA